MKDALLSLAVVLLALAPFAFAQVRQGSWTPVVESMERGYTSISYWTYRDDGVEIGGGRISIEHGKPNWPAMLDTAEAFDGATIGRLWRLGNNKWTTLDTQLTLRFGERVVAPGIYYLAIERPSADRWGLVFVDPEAVRGAFIDAWAAQARPAEVPRLFSVPLDYSSSEPSTELDISFSLDESDMGSGGVRVQWGPHRLEASMSIDVVSPTFYRMEGSR